MCQEEITELIERVKKVITENSSKKWNKCYGDACVRIFRAFILKELPNKYTASSPNAYIKGFSTEFDLLIVEKTAKPIKYTNIYVQKLVKCGIEIKASGIIARREELEKKIGKIKKSFDAVQMTCKHIQFVYFTYKDRAFTKRKNSIQYLKETKNGLAPHKVFCLKDDSTGKLINGEWQKLSNYLRSL